MSIVVAILVSSILVAFSYLVLNAGIIISIAFAIPWGAFIGVIYYSSKKRIHSKYMRIMKGKMIDWISGGANLISMSSAFLVTQINEVPYRERLLLSLLVFGLGHACYHMGKLYLGKEN